MSGLAISQLAKRFGLSRSTLLYYHKAGLLLPSERSEAGYRFYSDADMRRLEAICHYRKFGLNLDVIAELLDSGTEGTSVLEEHLEQLDTEIKRLQEQQRVTVRLLSEPKQLRKRKARDVKTWLRLIRSAGLDSAGVNRWHVIFERMAPKTHGAFLTALGLPRRDVNRIRKTAQRAAED